jgi:hypothetical protein
MEEVLRELTEFELDAVAGGNPFSQQNFAGSNTQNNENEQFAFVGIDQTSFFGSAVNFGNG